MGVGNESAAGVADALGRLNSALEEVQAAAASVRAAVRSSSPARLRPGRMLVRVAEAAGMLGVSRWTVYRLIQAGRLVPVHQGHITYLRVSDLEAYKDGL